MMSHDTRILAGEKTHAIAMIVKAVASIEKAGAVPAIPMMRDSRVPREFALRVFFCIEKKKHRQKSQCEVLRWAQDFLHEKYISPEFV